MVDYSKWDKFEDSDDERIAEDLRRVSKQPETLEQRQQAKESARRIARAFMSCLLYTSPSPRDGLLSRMPSSA